MPDCTEAENKTGPACYTMRGADYVRPHFQQSFCGSALLPLGAIVNTVSFFLVKAKWGVFSSLCLQTSNSWKWVINSRILEIADRKLFTYMHNFCSLLFFHKPHISSLLFTSIKGKSALICLKANMPTQGTRTRADAVYVRDRAS